LTDKAEHIKEMKEAAFRKETLSKMSRLYNVSVEKDIVIDGYNNKISVHFNKKENKHVYNDMLKKCGSRLKFEDLIKLDEYLKKATFSEDCPLYKERRDQIKNFLYFDVKINEMDMQIQVGKHVWASPKNNQIRAKYVVHCIKMK